MITIIKATGTAMAMAITFIFEEADFNYKDLMKAFKKFDIKGAIVCESPNIEIDTKILKEYYQSL